MLFNTDKGAPAVWGIGNRAQGTYDKHPGILMRLGQGVDDRGREGQVATLIILRSRLDGTLYLDQVRVIEDYVYDRTFSVPELDRPLDELVTALLAQQEDFFTRGEGIEAGEPAAETEAVEATVSDDLPFA